MEQISKKHPNTKSLDLIDENINKIKSLFPECIVEGELNENILLQVLGKDSHTQSDRYGLNWAGKSQAALFARKPTTSTLRPHNFDLNNQLDNLYIEGDNLEVLKCLQKSYIKSIKFIYIDPPYNTGNDFVYKDNFNEGLKSYLEYTGQTGQRGTKNSANAETSGRYHTNWLNMIYPRLILAKNLLQEDGVIFISISEEEYHNLKLICNEIFGEDNYRNTFIARRHDKNINTQFAESGLATLNVGYEYILCYSKSKDFNFSPSYREASENRKSTGYWKGFWNDADRPTMRYDILGFTPESGQWKWKKEVADEAVQNYIDYEKNFSTKMSLEEYWKSTGETKRFIRRKLTGTGKNKGVENWIPPSKGVLRNTNLTDILVTKKSGFIEGNFDFPKNTDLIKVLLELSGIKENEIVLDFFSGSASTAEATIEFAIKNSLFGLSYIMVQLPESTGDTSLPKITDIGKKRINNVTNHWCSQIENHKHFKCLQGYRSFYLDETNLKIWEINYEELSSLLDNFVDNVKENRTAKDVLFEILLKYGFPLNTPVDEVKIDEKSIFSVTSGALIICLEDEITIKNVEGILELKKVLDSKSTKVIFKDSGFANDLVKVNAVQLLKQYGIDDVKSI